ncbi:MAG: histidine kinase [Syntrophus sp. (in: bacteria)]|nr:histidine kinase [Syntrophus sp. (in: bacteria)]
MKTTVDQLLQRKGSEVVSVSPDALVYKALQLMQDEEVGALAVVDENGNLIGIVSERDYARKVILEGRSSKETFTKEIMSEKLYVVSPSTTVDECIALMTQKRIRHLPVLDKAKLIGIISIGDVVKSIIKEQQIEIESLNNYIMGKYI